MIRVYSRGASALACLVLVAGIAVVLMVGLRCAGTDDGRAKSSPIEVRIPAPWGRAPRPP